MKEIRTVRMVEQVDVVFVADDGKEFKGPSAELECARYERTRNISELKEAFERLNYIELKIPSIEYVTEEIRMFRIVLNSKHDFYAMMDYFDVVCGACDNELKMPESFPYTMNAVMNYSYINEYYGRFEDEFEATINKLREFEAGIKKNEVT